MDENARKMLPDRWEVQADFILLVFQTPIQILKIGTAAFFSQCR